MEGQIYLGSSGQDGGVGRNPSLPRTTKRGRTTNLKSKQPEAPENQTAWNSDNQGIEETVNHTNQTGRGVDRENLRQGGGPRGQCWLNGKQTQSLLWTTAVV